MDTLDALDHSFATTRSVVAQVHAEDLTRPTPCSEWDARALLEHMLESIDAFRAHAARTPAAETPTREVSDNVLEVYDEATSAALETWRAPGALDGEVTLGVGITIPAEVAAGISTADCLVHGWDLQRALGGDLEVDPELADHVLAISSAVVTPDFRGPATFGPEVTVGADASPTARLVGFLGRRP
jgi:uncharacterized protein (TIGR03086 family)